jgi:hypothetical protein
MRFLKSYGYRTSLLPLRFFAPSSLLALLGVVSAVVIASCDQPATKTGSLVTTAAITATCPGGNGFFALYYGTAASEIQTIRTARPNFVVVANESASWPDQYHYDDPVGHTGPTGIKVIAYIPMNYGRQNECAVPPDDTANTSCTNTSCNGCNDCVAIQTRITNAMTRGYDGVFFDETDSTNDSYNAGCYNSVKAFGIGKLIIDNPGAIPQTSSLFNAADIVSVENKYNVALPVYDGVPSWRWLAVQGDPGGATSLSDAQMRLGTFRSNGGFWYYSATPHWSLDAWFTDFATWSKGQPSVACAATYAVTVNALDIDHSNASINGLCVFIDNTTSCAGFTPLTTTLSAGSHTITMTNYPPNVFNHWDDGSTSAARTVNVTTTSTYQSYYHTL